MIKLLTFCAAQFICPFAFLVQERRSLKGLKFIFESMVEELGAKVALFLLLIRDFTFCMFSKAIIKNMLSSSLCT